MRPTPALLARRAQVECPIAVYMFHDTAAITLAVALEYESPGTTAFRFGRRSSTPLASGDDHVFGVVVIDALIEIAMGNDGLEARVFEGFEGFLET